MASRWCARPKAALRLRGRAGHHHRQAGRRIAPDNAWDHIAGYAAFNDGSVRDWQRHNIQFTPGKNWPATGAFGPALVTPDEVEDLGAIASRPA
jgi:2-keto-4-pentenoate hydratase/2-oxohepta-3-ene-1,7-dioic acid hydratase in catechol pathway